MLVAALCPCLAHAVPEDETEDDDVVVVGARATPDTASSIRLDDRDFTAAPNRNAEDLLRQVPGLTLVQHGSEGKGHQFFMRGFDAVHGSDIQITLEGLPINEWSNVHAQGYLDLGIILPEMVQSIVATKGPFTLGQGAFAMAGSADYQLGVPANRRGTHLAYTVGTTQRHRVFASYAPTEKGQGDSQGFIGLEATYDQGFGERRGLQRTTLNGRLPLLDEGQDRLALLALGSYAAFELPGSLRNDDVEAGVIDFLGAYDPLAGGRSARALTAMMFDRSTPTYDLSLTVYGGVRRLDLLENFTGFYFDNVEGDRREQFHEALSWGVNLQHETQLHPAVALLSGAGVRGERLHQREDGVGRQLQVLSTRRDLTADQVLLHALSGVRWTPNGRWRVDIGARLDRTAIRTTDHTQNDGVQKGSLLAVSPRATISIDPNDSWRLFAAFGRGFRPVEARVYSPFTVTETGITTDVFQGEEPAMTISNAAEVGAKWEPSSVLMAHVAGFATLIERESVFDHVSGTSLELNGTRRLGGEAVIELRPRPWLELSTDLTLVDARFVQSGNQVPLAPWLVSGVRGTVTHESGFQSGLRLITVAPRPLPHGAVGATLMMSDATVGYHWSKVRVDLELENLLGLQLREGEYHYASNWRQGQTASQIPVLHTTAGAPRNARLTLGLVF